MSTKHKQKQIDQLPLESSTRDTLIRQNNLIVEYVVSLSGVETQKIYIKHGFLGRGGFANCFITQQVGSNRFMAMKVIEKSSLKSSRTKLRLINQIKIHKTFTHCNIVQFIHYFEDFDNVYIMLQLCQNQSLNELLKERKTLTYPEVQSFLYGICNGVKYLHDKKFIHRDLKLGNIFLNDKFQIKIGDFGLTSQLEFLKENKRTVCGTPNYIAPQVLQGIGYYFEVDIWAIGIIIYTLFYGYPPFQSQTTSQIYCKIRKCQYKIPKIPSVPIQAVALIKSILVPKPQNRPSIQEILNSPFMKLGNGIPLQLPDITYTRTPNKAEIQAMPLLVIKDNILRENKKKINNLITATKEQESQKKHQKSTIDRTVSRQCNLMMTGMDFQQKQKTPTIITSSSKNLAYTTTQIKKEQRLSKTNNAPSDLDSLSPPKPLEHIIDLQQIDQNAFYFCTSGYVIGTYEKEREIVFRSVFEDGFPQIAQIKLYSNLFSQQGTIPYINYKYKSILTLKSKQLLKRLQKQQNHKTQNIKALSLSQRLVFITRITQHKELIMLKLSNKCIQVVYDTVKHGFLYEIALERLYYFQYLQGDGLSLELKELALSNVIETVKNYMKNSEKCGHKIPNIQSYVPVINTYNHKGVITSTSNSEYIKISIIKFKHIYGIISELNNKKGKHVRNRNSQ